MSIADKVKQSILNDCPNTFSLCAGYGMKEGEYVRWPTGVCIKENRNDKGQCLTSTYQYADGSTLTYKREPDNNYSLTVK